MAIGATARYRHNGISSYPSRHAQQYADESLSKEDMKARGSAGRFH